MFIFCQSIRRDSIFAEKAKSLICNNYVLWIKVRRSLGFKVLSIFEPISWPILGNSRTFFPNKRECLIDLNISYCAHLALGTRRFWTSPLIKQHETVFIIIKWKFVSRWHLLERFWYSKLVVWIIETARQLLFYGPSFTIPRPLFYEWWYEHFGTRLLAVRIELNWLPG